MQPQADKNTGMYLLMKQVLKICALTVQLTDKQVIVLQCDCIKLGGQCCIPSPRIPGPTRRPDAAIQLNNWPTGAANPLFYCWM